jgi:dCMP deaminase
MAQEQCRMSKDPSTRVGAVIVGPQLEVRSTGFNGFPRRICDSPERLADRETKLRLVVHAEMNAVLAAARVGIPLEGCTLYLAATDDTGAIWGGPPCTRCTVEILQAGIRNVVSRPPKAVPSRWHDDLRLSRALLDEAGVSYREVGEEGA